MPPKRKAEPANRKAAPKRKASSVVSGGAAAQKRANQGAAGASANLTKGGFALRSLSAVLSAVSSVGINRSPDGSRFQLGMERAPLHIPSHATNLTASLIKVSLTNDYASKFDMPNPIFVETSFTYGGVNARGDPSAVLAMVPHENSAGFINYEAATPLRVPCNTVLKGQNPQAVEFRLVDASGQPVRCVNPWSIQVLVEWEQEIRLDYLREDKNESQYY